MSIAFLTRYRLLPVHAGILLVFILIPVWYRFPGSPPAFSQLYSTGFLILWPMLWTIGWWLVTGLPGFAALRRNRVRRWWALALLMLALWGFLSAAWSYTGTFRPTPRPEITIGAALPFAVALLFALVVACAAPPRRLIVTVLVIGILWNSAIAVVQVGSQRDMGLRFLGEFPLNPDQPGVSVVQANGVRWLRPYGLLPHPNILAGFFAIGLLAAVAWVLDKRPSRWTVGVYIFLFGLWAFLLTFSRSAWIGFAAGGFAMLPRLWLGRLRQKDARTQLILLIVLAVLAAGVFALLYRPFLAARAGIGDESIELRSVSDRNVYASFAFRAISESPLLGVGMGNFPWRASYYLQFTTFDLRGEPVHHVLLLAWSELGLVGLGLTLIALITGTEAVRRYGYETEQVVLFGGFIALTIIGLFDHYPWTLLQFQAAWWGLLAAAGIPETAAVSRPELNSPAQAPAQSGDQPGHAP